MGLDTVEAGPAALPPPMAVPILPAAALPGLEAPAARPPERDDLHRPAKPFRPSSRRLARGRVAGTGEAHSTYGRIRTQFVQRMQENGWTSVAITSPTRGAGSTLTAVNLAVSIAQDFNYTVVLVELDFVKPSFRRMFGFPRQQRGIVDYLLHDTPMADIALTPGVERLVIIPAGARVSGSSALLSSPKMTCFIEEIRSCYENPIVLFDLPSVLSRDHAMAFAPLVDCALLVVAEGETRVNEVRCALDDLRATNVLGVVVNRSAHVGRDGDINFG